jgi:hypothetical protein
LLVILSRSLEPLFDRRHFGLWRGGAARRSAMGKLRLAKSPLLSTDEGSDILWEGYAIAGVDEVERPARVRQRFALGAEKGREGDALPAPP